MAKSKFADTASHIRKPKKNRKGVHSKKRNSRSKTSKNYKKKYQGQGR